MELTEQEAQQAKAVCYLQQANDEQNKCLLTEHELVVYYRGKVVNYPLANIKQLTFRFKRLIFPLLLGGIIAPFSLMGMFTQFSYGAGWLLATFMVGLLVFHYGWRGKNTFTITLPHGEEHFFINTITQNMLAFSRYVNTSLSQHDPRESMIYHIASPGHWQQQAGMATYTHPSLEKEGYIHASTLQQVVPSWQKHFDTQAGLLLLVIDPLLTGSEVKFEQGVNTVQLFPHIYGPINQQAIIAVGPLQTDANNHLVLPELQQR